MPDPVILLVAGNDLPAAFYAPLARELEQRGTRLVTLPLPGYDGTARLASPRLEALVEHVVAECVRHLGAGGTLAGHSFGGLVALLAAARASPSVERLILLEPWVAPRRWIAAAMARAYRRRVVERERDRFVNWTGMFRRVAAPERFPPAAIALYQTTRSQVDPRIIAAWLDDAAQLEPSACGVPTLIVRGAASGLWQRLTVAWLTRRLSATQVTLASAAHWLANEDDAALAELIVAPG